VEGQNKIFVVCEEITFVYNHIAFM